MKSLDIYKTPFILSVEILIPTTSITVAVAFLDLTLYLLTFEIPFLSRWEICYPDWAELSHTLPDVILLDLTMGDHMYMLKQHLVFTCVLDLHFQG